SHSVILLAGAFMGSEILTIDRAALLLSSGRPDFRANRRRWSKNDVPLDHVVDTSANTLFDDFERTNDDPFQFSESTYSYLNRAAGVRYSQIRALLEEWF